MDMRNDDIFGEGVGALTAQAVADKARELLRPTDLVLNGPIGPIAEHAGRLQQIANLSDEQVALAKGVGGRAVRPEQVDDCIVQDGQREDSRVGMNREPRKHVLLARSYGRVAAGRAEGQAAPDLRALTAAGDVGVRNAALGGSFWEGLQNIASMALPVAIDRH
ncbi:hypothetical protein J2848_003822 [Azospirillum lipoferum]|uniref:Uncharacterized protein n=1 Tax=Azospirillum lipoferum TaxID=193 RepID=A0A5A9GFC9_AZOLI|nr:MULTISPECIES: hypothetical protein [Azospirillum]KAA0591989.1 hypothetical protein FZ942_29240 [Azospirillum lipoferum]MCP1612142.1 hypothetical protein [Azospirillum lipoferum]MDW5536634.1 hypothetical protein [Azospirillum sp. NL1]